MTTISIRWFTPEFQSAHPEVFASALKMLESTNPEGYAACCAALRDFDARNELSAITVPPLVITGSHDPSTPPADGRYIAEKIPGSRCVELNAAHLSNLGEANRFTSEVENFLSA